MHTRRFVYRRKDDEVGRMMKWEGYEVEVRIIAVWVRYEP